MYRLEIKRLRLDFFLFAALILLCFFTGGSSRSDVPALLALRAFAVCALTFFALRIEPTMVKSVRVPLILLLALATLHGAQLIPLPATFWLALPGHDQFRQIIGLSELHAVWRPLSLTPDLTLDALTGLVVPVAVLIGFAVLNPLERWLVLPLILVGIVISVAFQALQLEAGQDSGLYLYAVTNRGSAVGLMANRNHQALLVAFVLPLVLTLLHSQLRPDRRLTAALISLATAFFAVPAALATGSRMGAIIVLGTLGLSFLIVLFQILDRRRALLVAPLGALAVCIAGLVMVWFHSSSSAIDRLFSTSFEDEQRYMVLPTLWKMLVAFFPTGAGFGSFDPLYRIYEPDVVLDPSYLNQAHNDLLQILIEGGIGGALLLAGFLWWFLREIGKRFGVWRKAPFTTPTLAAAIIIFITLLASLFDYPLRTPLIGSLFVIASAWLSIEEIAVSSKRARGD